MGSINNIYEPQNWGIIRVGINKNNPEDTVYFMEIGCFDDFICQGAITEYISKYNYDKVLSGEYTYKIVNKYSLHPVKIYNNKGEEVPLVRYSVDLNNIESQPER